jgi:hypothetical protein
VFGAPPIVDPVKVTVTNPVIPVEVSNADPIAVTVETAEAALVSCARTSIRGVGHTSGSVKIETGSVSAQIERPVLQYRAANHCLTACCSTN